MVHHFSNIILISFHFIKQSGDLLWCYLCIWHFSVKYLTNITKRFKTQKGNWLWSDWFLSKDSIKFYLKNKLNKVLKKTLTISIFSSYNITRSYNVEWTSRGMSISLGMDHDMTTWMSCLDREKLFQYSHMTTFHTMLSFLLMVTATWRASREREREI